MVVVESGFSLVIVKRVEVEGTCGGYFFTTIDWGCLGLDLYCFDQYLDSLMLDQHLDSLGIDQCDMGYLVLRHFFLHHSVDGQG